ncbi:MAG: aminotransferase class V-fold PLP-dependent enzyme [Planctomycetaceae bacterium]|jgi:D-glucosaminate-6-phosphate ammonia-lyase|nr:aminotransferase class V-fold PLP-dependent enzyme [Planctomycetaceae bacterium]
MTDLHSEYQLTKIINACGKMTHLCGAIVLPEIADQVRESLNHFFDLDELQAAAGKVIASTWGSETGCVTACTAAGITLSIAGCMTGTELGNVLQLPDATGMRNKIIIQTGHCVNYGAPITQNIRLAGAVPEIIGEVNRTLPVQLEQALQQQDIAAVLAVESHHTVRKGMLSLAEIISLAHQYETPVIVDAAAQDQRMSELINLGVDLVITSAHKYLCSTTAGIIAGKGKYVEAVYLQNRGIGRGMKAGKEAIVGAIAAMEYRANEDVQAWTVEQDRKVDRIMELLSNIDGLSLGIDKDPNGCPFSRVRLTPDPNVTSHDAHSLNRALAEGNPSVVARAHHANEGFLYLDAIEMTDEELELACNKVCDLLS